MKSRMTVSPSFLTMGNITSSPNLLITLVREICFFLTYHLKKTLAQTSMQSPEFKPIVHEREIIQVSIKNRAIPDDQILYWQYGKLFRIHESYMPTSTKF